MLSSSRRARRAAHLLAAGAAVALALTGVAAAAPPQTGAPSGADARDTDGDGLLDSWERNGYDADGDGKIDVDLPAMGADPMHKDIFIEMDYMGAEKKCPCHLPLKKDLERIVEIFAKSPSADNPDGKRGITIHLDDGGARGKKFDLGGGNKIPHDDDLNPYQSEYAAIRAEHFDPDRDKIFHYMLWAHGYGGGSSSGVSFGIPADGFLVTLGLWPEHGSSDAKVGTFIHELGHNLGLRHGGNQDINYKPNYLSVMTYAFQIDGVPRTKGKPGYHGYSNLLLPPLNETALKERDGLDDKKAKKFRTEWFCPDGELTAGDRSVVKPIDWNCNGNTKETSTADINGDGGRTTLTSHKDWGNLVFDGGRIGEGVVSDEAPEIVDELTYEEYLDHAH
jgi:hypothetical protein